MNITETDPIKIEFYDMNFNVFGYSNTSIQDIKARKSIEIFDLKSNKKIGSANINLIFETRKNFVDYLADGMQINLVIGIDFTASNGDKHNLSDDPTVKNDYEIAILAIGKILEIYSYKCCFSGYGFGAIPPGI